jgi:hypothetical protein
LYKSKHESNFKHEFEFLHRMTRCCSYFFYGAAADRFRAAALTFDALEVMLFSVALLVLLQRMIDLLSCGDNWAMQRNNRIVRCVYTAVVLCNTVGLCCSVAASSNLGAAVGVQISLADAASKNFTLVSHQFCSSLPECQAMLLSHVQSSNLLTSMSHRFEAVVVALLITSFITACFLFHKVEIYLVFSSSSTSLSWSNAFHASFI